MSLQIRVRFEGNQPEAEYESNLISHAYALFESVRGELDAPNFLATPWTTNEEDLLDALEEEMGDEPEDFEAFEAFEEEQENELGRRGTFMPVTEFLDAVGSYRAHFEARRGETVALDERHEATTDDLVIDLAALEEELARNKRGRVRLVIG